MKKIYVFILGIVITFGFSINKVLAVTPTYTCSDLNNCVLICQYSEEIKQTERSRINPAVSSASTKNVVIEIYNYPNTNEYEFIAMGIEGKKEIRYKGTYEDIMSENQLYGANFREGECPIDVSIDLSDNLFSIDGLCLGYNEVDCAFSQDKSELGWTRFTNHQREGIFDNTTHISEKIRTTRTYDFLGPVTESVSTIFNEYASKNFTIDETKSYEENATCVEAASNENYATEKGNEMISYIKTAIKNQYFKGKNLPNWVESAIPYNSVTTYFTSGEGVNILKKCGTIVSNDDSLSNDEKNEILGKLELHLNEFYDFVYTYFENYLHFEFSDDFTGPETCSGFLGNVLNDNSPAYYLHLILQIMRYAAIILTIVLSTMDYLKAVTAQDKDLLKKATTNAVKRLIFTVILFMLPILIEFILGLLGAYSSCIE